MTALFFLPLQGFFNCIVYVLPRLKCIKRLRHRDLNGSDSRSQRRFSGPFDTFDRGTLWVLSRRTTTSASATNKATGNGGSGVITSERNSSDDPEDPNKHKHEGMNNDDSHGIAKDHLQECAPGSQDVNETKEKTRRIVSFESDQTMES
eukprot:CAMPEP_0116850928 /NCGR_PEP_ID=MMETSP0418-20121206/16432_1 /TAXON_ID=1158023 /ORGANISM="Astrosyne radiata, Strain 13vi08-1A" /LENGTH=148 /DNA_ID=CAMNT_0004482879 /DNA_START=168 /DNA_END=614 /DNA_ORIENTATION=-